MPRFHPIPLISLSLCGACPPAADPVGTEASTGSGDGTQGVSETGAPVATTGGVTATEGPVTDPAPGTDTGTTGAAPDTAGDTQTSTGDSCPNTGGDPPGPDPEQCHAGTCDPGSICLRTISCDLVAAPCDGSCVQETRPTHCVPIPEECKARPESLEACLEKEFFLCSYGGEYQDGLLDCQYVFDQCGEGGGYDMYPPCN